MRQPFAAIAVAALALLAIVILPSLSVRANGSMFCNGLPVTIYVNGSNMIVGGPNDGDTYLGVLNGGSGADVIMGTTGDDIINGRGGADTICGDDGDDLIDGGDDNDFLCGDNDEDMIAGRDGNDTLCGGNDDDILIGGDGDDDLDGGDDVDALFGADDSDTCANGEINVQCEDTGSPVPACDAKSGTGSSSSMSSSSSTSTGSSSSSSSSTGTGSACVPGNLIAYWPMDEGTGGTINDVVGANHANLQNGAGFFMPAAPAGFFNPWALDLDGTNDFADPGTNVGNFMVGTPFSIAAWVQINLDGTQQVIYANAWQLPGHHLRVTDQNRVRFILITNGTNFLGVDSSVLSPGWHHVVGVWDGATPRVYVDGVEDSAAPVAGGTLTSITTAAPTQIGRTPEAGNEHYAEGQIDDLRVYDTALGSGAVAELYNGCNVSSSSSSSSMSSSSSTSTGSSTSSSSSSSSVSSSSSSSSSTGATLCNGLVPTITGTDSANILNGTSGDDVILGLGGGDIINGFGGNDTICGGDANDIINGGDGDDWIDGQAGNDIINGRDDNDTLLGSEGNDVINGGRDDDTLDGGPDSDLCNGGPGTDNIVNCE